MLDSDLMDLFNIISLVGRIIFGGFFLVMGLNHFINVKPLAGWVSMMGFPTPNLLVLVSGIVIIFGGAFTAAGFQARIGLFMIAGFLVLASLMFHTFWRFSDPNQKQNEQIHFAKNTALFGAAIALMSSV